MWLYGTTAVRDGVRVSGGPGTVPMFGAPRHVAQLGNRTRPTKTAS